jgi:mannose-6-phosphate isomerase-like protein (cupin superfamily)
MIRTTMNPLLTSVIGCVLILTPSQITQAEPHPLTSEAPQVINKPYADLKWEWIMPELGERSPEITFLRSDPHTKATHLMIRVPKNFHVPPHWHTANETHTIVSGTFIVECQGERATLVPGSWNYVPSKTSHEAWTKPDEGTLLFITVDGAWDVNWTLGPPKPADFAGGRTE